jgi:GntR family transcriptional regulator, transcriptional repressor for pyruvate dehydrogenase complex
MLFSVRTPTTRVNSTKQAAKKPAKKQAAQARSTKKTHELVSDQLRQRIVNGELTEGQRLPPEDELTTQFGVARTTLREALRVLESQGLIAIRRGRGGGPVVTHPNLEPIAMALAVTLQLNGTTIGDLDAARQMIEPQIAGQLAKQHDDSDIAALEAAIDLAADAAERNDGQAFGLAAASVHETLVERSGNRTLATLTNLLHNMVRAYYAKNMYRVDQALMQRAVRGYRKLVGLIRDGDADAAIAHWHATMNYTISSRDPDEPVTIASGA